MTERRIAELEARVTALEADRPAAAGRLQAEIAADTLAQLRRLSGLIEVFVARGA
jgi:hypothetical protein